MLFLGTLVILTIPAWFLNQWLMRLIRPREAFRRFLLYMAVSLAMAFLYTFLLIYVFARLAQMRKAGKPVRHPVAVTADRGNRPWKNQYI